MPASISASVCLSVFLFVCLSVQGPTKFFAAYKQISLIGSVPTKFTINSTTNCGLCLQAALACLPTLSGPGQENESKRHVCLLKLFVYAPGDVCFSLGWCFPDLVAISQSILEKCSLPRNQSLKIHQLVVQ